MRSIKNDATKLCTSCKKELPNNTEHFYHARQRNRDGNYRHSLRGKCKICYVGPPKEKIIKTHKTCTNCHTSFLNTNEHFRFITDTRGCRYLTAHCKKCETVNNAKYSLIRDHKRRSKELDISLEEYSNNSRKYMGWSGHKLKNPSHTYNDYLKFKESRKERTDIQRKNQREILTDNYVKQLMCKHNNLSVYDFDNYPEIVEIHRINLLIKRKVYGKCNTA